MIRDLAIIALGLLLLGVSLRGAYVDMKSFRGR